LHALSAGKPDLEHFMDKCADGPREWRLEFPDQPPTEPEGELEVWASSSEPDEVSVSLVFGGETVDPDAITRLLGVGPTTFRRAGEPPSGPLLPSTQRGGFWRLMATHRVRDSSVEAQILKLLAQLPPPGPVWETLRPLSGQLFCGLFLEVWNRECYLSPAVLAAALERHLALRLDIYYEPGNQLSAVEDDDE
jgi:Domain of unknown function (DUF4279)